MSYLPQVADENDLPAFRLISEGFGFVPNFYRVQAIRPGLIDAQVEFVDAITRQERRPYPSRQGIHLPRVLGSESQHILCNSSLRDRANAWD